MRSLSTYISFVPSRDQKGRLIWGCGERCATSGVRVRVARSITSLKPEPVLYARRSSVGESVGWIIDTLAIAATRVRCLVETAILSTARLPALFLSVDQ